MDIRQPRHHPARRLMLSAMLCLGAGGAHAETQHLVLNGGNAVSGLHAKSLLGDVDGSFSQVKGQLDYDLSDQTCKVDMTMTVDSLKVDSAVMRKLMLSGALLDADKYPTMHFSGHCVPLVKDGKVITQLSGELTMRDQTHPVTFITQMIFNHNTLVKLRSSTTFDQRRWGVSTMLHTVHPMVSSTAEITLDSTAATSAAPAASKS
ncbi:YceI family protein [Frateuria aurantia]